MRGPIVISGLGCVSSLGTGTAATWAAVESGRDGIRAIERFSTRDFGVHLGGMVPSTATLRPDDGAAAQALCLSFALTAAQEALAAARVDVPPGRLALVLGTSMLSRDAGMHEIAEKLGDAVGALGPRLTVSTACASSTNALGVARDLLGEGRADVVLAGGADALTPENFAGFHALGLLSPGKCAPFSVDLGTTLGEGAGFLVLEHAEHAARRGCTPRHGLAGYGLAADAHHATSPDPTGAGVARALLAALGDAGIPAAEVDYLNAHGTGTAANDAAEWRAIESVFGAHAARLPVSSSKSYLGHAQGAAGVLELIVTLLCLEHGVIPPTLHLSAPRPRGPADPVAAERPRPRAVRWAVSTNSAFGGANAAVVVGPAGAMPRPAALDRSVYLGGVGSVGGADAEPAIERLLPTANARGLDPASRRVTIAAALALADARVSLHGRSRERAGLFVGTTTASPSMAAELRASIDARGLARLSATAFTHLVLNASAGVATRLLALKGPTTAVTVGRGSGLLALVLAAQHLRRRDDADQLLAAGVDEVPRDEPQPEGAVAMLLSTQPGAVRVIGWGLAGPGDARSAEAQARLQAGLSRHEPIAQVRSTAELAKAAAAGALVHVAEAVTALREGTLQRAAVVEASSAGVTLAVILERSEPC